MNCLQCLYHAEIKREIEMISPIGPPEYCQLKLELLRSYDPCQYYVKASSSATDNIVDLRELGRVISDLPTPDSETATRLLQDFENKRDVFSLYQLQKFLAQNHVYIQSKDVQDIFREGREFIVSKAKLSGYTVATIEALTLIKEGKGSQELANIRKQIDAVGQMEGYDCSLIAYLNIGRMVKQGLVKSDLNPRFLLGYKDTSILSLSDKGEELLSSFEAKVGELLKFISEHEGCTILEVRNYWLAHCSDALESAFSSFKERLAKEQWFMPVFDRLELKGLVDIEKVGGNYFRAGFQGDENRVRITQKGKATLAEKQNILKALSLCD